MASVIVTVAGLLVTPPLEAVIVADPEVYKAV
jgi:hypothetical protein